MARGYIGVTEEKSIEQAVAYIQEGGLRVYCPLGKDSPVGIRIEGPYEAFQKLFPDNQVPSELEGIISWALLTDPIDKQLPDKPCKYDKGRDFY